MHDGFSHDFGGFDQGFEDPWSSFERRQSQKQPQVNYKDLKPKENENNKNLTSLKNNDRKEKEAGVTTTQSEKA